MQECEREALIAKKHDVDGKKVGDFWPWARRRNGRKSPRLSLPSLCACWKGLARARVSNGFIFLATLALSWSTVQRHHRFDSQWLTYHPLLERLQKSGESERLLNLVRFDQFYTSVWLVVQRAPPRPKAYNFEHFLRPPKRKEMRSKKKKKFYFLLRDSFSLFHRGFKSLKALNPRKRPLFPRHWDVPKARSLPKRFWHGQFYLPEENLSRQGNLSKAFFFKAHWRSVMEVSLRLSFIISPSPPPTCFARPFQPSEKGNNDILCFIASLKDSRWSVLGWNAKCASNTNISLTNPSWKSMTGLGQTGLTGQGVNPKTYIIALQFFCLSSSSSSSTFHWQRGRNCQFPASWHRLGSVSAGYSGLSWLLFPFIVQIWSLEEKFRFECTDG